MEPILVLLSRPRAFAHGELAQGVGSDRWPESEVQELGKAAPVVALDLHEPQLRNIEQIVRCHPDLFFFRDVLLEKVGLALVNECQGITFAVILGEIHLLEFWGAIIVVLAGAVVVVGGGAVAGWWTLLF